MKTGGIKIKPHLLFILGSMIIMGSCHQMSEHIEDKSAGMNGGFEVSKNGLPVNWLMYTPKTVPDGDFNIILDKDIFKEGKQSLRFEVKACSSAGEWRSPGFTNDFFEIGKYRGEGQYKLSCWIRNDGTEFSLSAGGVSAKTGNMITFIRESKPLNEWELLEYTIDVPEDQWLRMQLNILKPGSFWIDDIRIEKI